ncbi:hypothetical protein BDW71DRAFT_208106 [Aspergillus fruticulosus]
MDTDEAIKVYDELASIVFSAKVLLFNLQNWGRVGYRLANPALKAKAFLLPAQFSDELLIEAIDELVGDHGIDIMDKKETGNSYLVLDKADETGKMSTCATLTNGKECLLRSHPAPEDDEASRLSGLPSLKISKAVRATSAAPRTCLSSQLQMEN